MHYSEDSFTMKFVVAAVWILDTLHTSSVCHILYYYLITNYGNLLSLEHVVWSFPTSFLANVRLFHLKTTYDNIWLYCSYL
ncbi:hypothetical protein M404DRAFT_287895 [Pisolithus tinctorius Marx 270]|uniref:Uncharacterized protein n=1 Tax=Pisolithus tinctorius Marx 270 TaxID=870435 RepID=A0A0C3P8E2_PISTI|nr:hypothetical protein M404DRAFT_287895 [Pisolithus tinctorius Marx 270]